MAKRFYSSRFWNSRYFSGGLWGGDGADLVAQPIVGGPDFGVTAANILLVYDSSNSDSVAVKEYYRTVRPGMTSAHTLGFNLSGLLSGSPNNWEKISIANYNTAIRDPLATYLAANSGVHYIVRCFGMPTRTVEGDTFSTGSIPYMMSRVGNTSPSSRYDDGTDGGTFDRTKRFNSNTWSTYGVTRSIVTDINFNTRAACEAYIDALAAAHPGGDQIYIYANERYGSTYHIDANRNSAQSAALNAEEYEDALDDLLDSAHTISFTADDTTPISMASAVRALVTWAQHNGVYSGNSWITNGQLTFSGTSGRFLFMPFYSFAGRYSEGYVNAFNATAFGGSAYSNIPWGMPAAVEEPFASGMNHETLITGWEYGLSFGEAAWQSRRTIWFVAFGDPFVSGGTFIPSAGRTFKAGAYVPGAQKGLAYVPGAQRGFAFVPGAQKGLAV